MMIIHSQIVRLDRLINGRILIQLMSLDLIQQVQHDLSLQQHHVVLPGVDDDDDEDEADSFDLI